MSEVTMVLFPTPSARGCQRHLEMQPHETRQKLTVADEENADIPPHGRQE